MAYTTSQWRCFYHGSRQQLGHNHFNVRQFYWNDKFRHQERGSSISSKPKFQEWFNCCDRVIIVICGFLNVLFYIIYVCFVTMRPIFRTNDSILWLVTWQPCVSFCWWTSIKLKSNQKKHVLYPADPKIIFKFWKCIWEWCKSDIPDILAKAPNGDIWVSFQIN